jgi:hypothetical protein
VSLTVSWRRAGTRVYPLAALAGFLFALPARGEDEPGERSPVSTVLFASLEAGPAKRFAAFGLKRAITGGLDASGFRAFAKLGGAQETPKGRSPRGTLYKAEAQALLGYEWRIGDSFVSLYAGADYEEEFRVCNCAVSVTTRFGARLQGDLWATPTRQTMLQASAYVSTMDRRLWGRLAGGWTVPLGLYIGPEIEAYRQTGYHKLRLGLHATGIRLLGLTWRLSGGWQTTSDRPGEAYATLGVHWRR